jgi:hypothetical protein
MCTCYYRKWSCICQPRSLDSRLKCHCYTVRLYTIRKSSPQCQTKSPRDS